MLAAPDRRRRRRAGVGESLQPQQQLQIRIESSGRPPGSAGRPATDGARAGNAPKTIRMTNSSPIVERILVVTGEAYSASVRARTAIRREATAAGRRWPVTADWPGRSATRSMSARPAPGPRRVRSPTRKPDHRQIRCQPSAARRTGRRRRASPGRTPGARRPSRPAPRAPGRPVHAGAVRRRRRARSRRRSPAPIGRNDPAVEHPGRQHQHVGGEPVAADVAALPHPPGAELVERRGHRTTRESRSTRHACRARTLHTPARVIVVGASLRRRGAARMPRTIELRQLIDRRQNVPTPGVLDPGGNRPGPTVAARRRWSGRVGGSPRLAPAAGSVRATSRCAAVRSNRESSKPGSPPRARLLDQ